MPSPAVLHSSGDIIGCTTSEPTHSLPEESTPQLRSGAGVRHLQLAGPCVVASLCQARVTLHTRR